jgi:hypothetical protein
MNRRQRELKRKYQADQRFQATSPEIDCLECEHCQDRKCLDVEGIVEYWCGHPEADLLRGRILYKRVGAVSLDLLNAPAECPRRR